MALKIFTAKDKLIFFSRSRFPNRDPQRVAEFMNPAGTDASASEPRGVDSTTVTGLLVTGNVEVLSSPLLSLTDNPITLEKPL